MLYYKCRSLVPCLTLAKLLQQKVEKVVKLAKAEKVENPHRVNLDVLDDAFAVDEEVLLFHLHKWYNTVVFYIYRMTIVYHFIKNEMEHFIKMKWIYNLRYKFLEFKLPVVK